MADTTTRGQRLARVLRKVRVSAETPVLLASERLLREPPRRVSQQALYQRLRCLPAALVGDVLAETLPTLQSSHTMHMGPGQSWHATFGMLW